MFSIAGAAALVAALVAALIAALTAALAAALAVATAVAVVVVAIVAALTEQPGYCSQHVSAGPSLYTFCVSHAHGTHVYRSGIGIQQD